MPGASVELCWGGLLNRRRIGARGEALALGQLAKKGYEPFERNTGRVAERSTLVVRNEKTLLFLEVKPRRGMGFGDPLEAVTPRKLAKIRLVAEQYLASKGEECTAGFDKLRFEVVGILLGTGYPVVQHVEGAF